MLYAIRFVFGGGLDNKGHHVPMTNSGELGRL
jgi:hypothetical protein